MKFGLWISGVFLLIVALFLVLARRDKGPRHIIRTITGCMGLMITLAILYSSLQVLSPGSYYQDRLLPIYSQLEQHQISAALDGLFQLTDDDVLIIGAVICLASMTLLGWPAKRTLQTLPTPPAMPERTEGELK